MKILNTKKIVSTLLLMLLSLATTHQVNADIVVGFINESDLPYKMSPDKYDNSPDKYDNSVDKYGNSPDKYDNSPDKYDNSPDNYKNSANGKRSIVLEENGSLYHKGYYVSASDGVVNYFSASGNRIFYSPSNSQNLYHGTQGFFCGLLARQSGVYKMVLTKAGERTLMLGE